MLLICLPVPPLKFCEEKGMFFILSSLALSLTLRCVGTLRTVFDVVVLFDFTTHIPTLLTMSIGEWFVLNVQSQMCCTNPPVTASPISLRKPRVMVCLCSFKATVAQKTQTELLVRSSLTTFWSQN